ncbi:S8 family serine peptidase [Streptobacillus moniliformis]|uniref:S8 family serine peptidase n=1 Tax=Streptobacillus moniliformis TaxID=34105 RepID=UPI0007E3251F|nr:S8 family serine peptidase [Streptobacillus moniliformis]
MEQKKAYKDGENPVTILESYVNQGRISEIKNKYSFLIFENANDNPNYKNHAFEVIDSFMDTDGDGVVSETEKNAFNDKTVNIKLARGNNTEGIKGIINMSYAIVESNNNFRYLYKDSKYLDKIYPNYNTNSYLNSHLTSRLLNKDYVYNEKLLISSLGNENHSRINTKYFSNSILNNYQIMSPEMQALARSESIMVKNSVNRKHSLIGTYYNNINTSYIDSESGYYIDKLINQYFQAQSLLLRSFTVGEVGLLKNEQEGYYPYFGSSYSAPRIARLAYDIKEKYPFLIYQQVKQVILGTANHSIDGYLDDNVGWGNANREKALKGPSDFNAGLIDEMKYFKGNYDKIFDEKGNRYFYVDIKKDKEYTFENDITSGLKGDGTTRDERIIKIDGTKNKHELNSNKYSYRIPKVLESEKLFYSNVAQAGLRKDGEGKLILTGKQEYSAPSQVLDGTLVLKNDSNSDYTVYEKGTLVIENKINDENKEIKLKNIYTDGKVDIKSNATLENLYGSDKYKIEFIGKNIKIKEFKTTGEYIVRLINGNLDEIPRLEIEKFTEEDRKSLDNLSNPFLKPVVINENKIVSIKFVGTLEDEFKKLSEITDENILKDLPSYDINKKKFFDEYKEDSRNYRSSNNIMKPMSSDIKSLLLNSSNGEVKNIFTDNYASIVGNIIKNEIDNKCNRTNIILNNLEKRNRLFFDTYARTNILNDAKFSPFVDNNVGAIIGYSRKLSNGNTVNLYGIYQYGNVEFKNNGSNKSKSINNLYNLGVNISKKYWIYLRLILIRIYGIAEVMYIMIVTMLIKKQMYYIV